MKAQFNTRLDSVLAAKARRDIIEHNTSKELWMHEAVTRFLALPIAVRRTVFHGHATLVGRKVKQ